MKASDIEIGGTYLVRRGGYSSGLRRAKIVSQGEGHAWAVQFDGRSDTSTITARLIVARCYDSPKMFARDLLDVCEHIYLSAQANQVESAPEVLAVMDAIKALSAWCMTSDHDTKIIKLLRNKLSKALTEQKLWDTTQQLNREIWE